MKLRARAPGKVNLCLFVGGVRADGRHELVTLFESVSLADELAMSTLPEGSDDRVLCPAVPGPNLVALALERLRERGWSGPPVLVEIDKRVPIAGGMGGGSADAAAALRLAMELSPGRPEEVAAIAAELGADVPSQLAPGVTLGTGAGEIVEGAAPLAEHAFVIVSQGTELSTAAVYREADRIGVTRGREELEALAGALEAELRAGERLPRDLLQNDLERCAVSLSPGIADARERVRGVGADEVFVCGSGPTVAGLWWGADEGPARRAARALAERYPGTTVAHPVGPEFGAPEVLE